MSQTLRRAAETPARASISTPVLPTEVTMTSAATASARSSKATSTPVIGMGWHMGIVRGVSFTAWMAATLATVRTSPFATSPSRIA
ncbi:MAG: hypothetical protein A4E51_01107 [Methanosaeta sp. PtaU1.Bin055]|nr:MAG: hypothetical protein A4E51_01107 [Methanosaeta sp. PtaU1.Bin055]